MKHLSEAFQVEEMPKIDILDSCADAHTTYYGQKYISKSLNHLQLPGVIFYLNQTDKQ